MTRFRQFGLCVALVCGFASQAGAITLKANERVAFVLVSLRTAIYETPYLDECPYGIASGNDEIWWKGLSQLDRDKQTNSGTKEPASRRSVATRRGPNKEDVCWLPELVKDPPQKTVLGKIAYGLNLDGRDDGAATPKTCAHQNFVGPNGETGIDNQMYRMVGCIYGWRSEGYIESVADEERRSSSKGLWLIEIVALDEVQPSQKVQVNFFRVVDNLRKAANGDILPYASYRVDPAPLFTHTITGTLTNNVLVTDRADARLPFYGNRVSTDMILRDMGLNLELSTSGDKAEGLLTGYHDLENWWDYVRKMAYLIDTAQYSCPALYQAAHELADGYPDPKTGNCTAISTAYQVKLLPAFIARAAARPEEGADAPFVKKLTSDQILTPAKALETAAPGHPSVFTATPGPTGVLLADHVGRTVYTSANKQACDAACLRQWRPVEAAWTSEPSTDWTIVPRKDGTSQWAFRGSPLYTCARDAKPNIASCDGEGWQAVVLSALPAWPAWVTRQSTSIGTIFADQRGHTLYVLLGDRAEFEREICDAACVALWSPVKAEAGAQAIGDWKPKFENGVGTWLYRGTAVYTYAKDKVPGEIAGHMIGGASVSTKNYWSALPPEIADLSSPRLAP